MAVLVVCAWLVYDALSLLLGLVPGYPVAILSKCGTQPYRYCKRGYSKKFEDHVDLNT